MVRPLQCQPWTLFLRTWIRERPIWHGLLSIPTSDRMEDPFPLCQQSAASQVRHACTRTIPTRISRHHLLGRGQRHGQVRRHGRRCWDQERGCRAQCIRTRGRLSRYVVVGGLEKDSSPATVVNFHFASGARADVRPGPPTEETQELTDRLAAVVKRCVSHERWGRSLLIGCRCVLDTKTLCLTPGVLSRVLYIDAVCLCDAGNTFSAALLAVMAALKNGRIRCMYPVSKPSSRASLPRD